MANTWLNNDGLYLKYGTDKAIPEVAGDFLMPGANRVVEIDLDLTTLTSSDAVISDTTFFPTNVRIEAVEVLVETAATGTGATLNVGLMQTDRATVIATGAFVSAVAQTALTPAGTRLELTVGSTGVGSEVGTLITAGGYISAKYNTAAFTAGKARIRIYYHGEGTITQ